MSTISTPKTIDDLKPDDSVLSCKYIEKGSCFSLDGIHCCVAGTVESPLIITAEELRGGKVDYDLVVQRRRELFSAINGFSEGPTDPCRTCANLKPKKYRDVNFEYLGGEPLTAGMNIQHYSECNQRCTYCTFTTSDNFVKSQYEILPYLEMFRKQGKLRGNNWIDFSGGEPSMLKNFDQILNYLLDNSLGTVVVYSNSMIFSQSIYNALKQNRIILTTSLDAGTATTYKNVRKMNGYSQVLRNLIRYKNSGTRGLWLKYIVTDLNRTEDDLWGFVTAMLALKPDKIQICPDFPYGAREISAETVDFAAKLFHILERVTGMKPTDYSTDFGDPKWLKYRQDLAKAIEELAERNPYGNFEKFQELKPVSATRNLTIRLRRNIERFWDSGFRKRYLPSGSSGEKWARIAWWRTIGRFV
jgi:organic radical activating enzyme